jgi:release factor glutamine methyltransferase
MAGNLTVDALLAEGIRLLREGCNVPAASAVGPANEPPAASLPASVRYPDLADLHLDAELLLSHSLSMSRTQIKTHPETSPSAERARRFLDLIQRRADGEPVAYIVGHRDFWTLRLSVSPAVLVPRPETELLIERALALRPEPSGKVVDLGTGSGAIALALASERPQWAVTATDASPDALAVARANATANGLSRVEFAAGNWFEPLAGRRFDLVLSNPPYIDGSDPALLSAALRHEPRMALTPGPDGLACLRAIVHSAPHYLERHGWLLLEHGSDQAAAVARELVVRGFGHVRSHRDLAGHERMTEAQWT